MSVVKSFAIWQIDEHKIICIHPFNWICHSYPIKKVQHKNYTHWKVVGVAVVMVVVLLVSSNSNSSLSTGGNKMSERNVWLDSGL